MKTNYPHSSFPSPWPSPASAMPALPPLRKANGRSNHRDQAGCRRQVGLPRYSRMPDREAVTLTITDDLTLDKFKDKRIVEGDEIRARFEKDGKNTSKSFRRLRAAEAIMGKLQILSAAVVIISLGLASAVSAEEMKGKVKSVSNLARTIAVEVENKGVVVFKFDASTQFKNATAAKDIIADEVITIDFSQAGSENRAKIISKVIAPLPAGVARISAEELQEL